jgi:hypothetical protein
MKSDYRGKYRTPPAQVAIERIFRRSSAHHAFPSSSRPRLQSAVTCRSGWPICLFTLILFLNHDSCLPLLIAGEGEVESGV